MRLAWFRPAAPDPADPLDDTGALLTELSCSRDIDVVTAARAHEFVWMQFRRPYDLCVFELDNTPSHSFIWPYLLHFPGVTLLRSLMLNGSRAAALARQRRLDDYRTESQFSGDGRLLRAPLLASRSVVVPHTTVAEALQDEYPEARIRVAQVGVQQVQGVQGVQQVQEVQEVQQVQPVRVGVVGSDREDVVRRACERARSAGAPVTLLVGEPPERTLRDADVVVSLRWPPFGEPQTGALAGMAAGTPVVVMETEATAHWPAYDPQTWRPRGHDRRAPIAVSIDPRDEEHSLMVAMRDLARDAGMRASLGAAARQWWEAHATVAHAAAAWQPLLAEAVTLAPPARPADWPAHLTADGTEAARAILAEMGASVDFLR